MIVGILAMMAFNLVDTYFVGHLGTAELAALSFTFSVVMLVGSIALGLGVGAAAVVSRAIGEGDHHRVRRLTTDSLLLSLFVVAVFVIIGQSTIEPVFRLLGVGAELMPLVRQYMRVWYFGMLFVVVPMVGNNAIRATGDTKTPALIMLTAVAVNAILDPLLIFGIGPFPRLELAGAALATVMARAAALVASLWVLHKRERMLTFTLPKIRRLLESYGRILSIGLPAATTNIIAPISVGIIMRLISAYGAETVAGVGVAFRIQTFVMTVIMALFSVLGPFVGQNWGASRWDRIRKGVHYSHLFAMGWGITLCAILAVFGRSIASLFNDTPSVVESAATYLMIIPIGFGFMGLLRLSTAALNVLNRALHSTILTFLQAVVLLLPLAYWGSHLFGLKGVLWAGSISSVISGTAAFFWLRRIFDIEESKTSSSNVAFDI